MRVDKNRKRLPGNFLMRINRAVDFKGGFLALLLLGLAFTALATEQLLRYPSGASGDDFRYAYPVRVLQLVLDKTSAEYGPARVVNAMEPMSTARIIFELEKGEKLDVMTSGASRELTKRLRPVPVCIRRGILGIRLFLIDEKRQSQFSDIRTLEALKKLSVGQVFDWLDTSILRSNDFSVVTGNNYQGLFRMLMLNRFDLFPRGLHEPFVEVRRFAPGLPGLAVEKTLALYYPDPDYFWVRKANTVLAERLRKGLEAAMGDGSFNTLFESEFGESIRQARLDKRLFIGIPNPELDRLPHDGDPDYWLIEQMKKAGKIHFAQ